MSRRPDDAYMTPPWCLWRLLEAVTLPGSAWLDPCAGDGRLARAIGWSVDCWDIAPRAAHVIEIDFLLVPPPERPWWDVIVTNPPYSLAEEFVVQAMLFAPVVVMLLRLNWLASERRAPFLRKNTPAIYVLPNRPSFTDGGTDQTEYAWFVWGLGPPTVTILKSTPKDQR